MKEKVKAKTETEAEIVEALDAFAAGRFPREIGYRFEKGFVRNRYVHSAAELAKRLGRIEKDFFVSVYSFSEAPEDKTAWDRSKAIIDRMFFDFDCKESLTPALREAKKLIRHLSGIPIVIFSGSKGFHVHVLFKPVRVDAKAIKVAGAKIVEQLKLKTCDTQVFEVARLCRAPFSVHSSTGLRATIISPHRFMKMGSSDVIRFVKRQRWDFPEYELDDSFAEMLDIVDVILYEEEIRKREMAAREVITAEPDGSYRISSRPVAGRKRRIEYYVNALKKHGCLAADPRIRATHAMSEWVAKHGRNMGAVEHIARVHLILMMIEEGWSDEEIHAAFKHAKDYSYERTQYYIDYNRKWLAEKKRKEAY